MERSKRCRIVAVGKRRDGGIRYWCLEHKADATAKYGQRAKQCRYAHIPPILPSETLRLNAARYEGGVALWGAVAPIYDTTRIPAARGIHVHARFIPGGDKKIDATYRCVSLVQTPETFPKEDLVISELDAIYYMVTAVFGYPMKYVKCTWCGFPHLDKDWFSVRPHRRHLCAGCGTHFRDFERAIGNPIRRVQEVFGHRARAAKPAKRTLKIKQVDYPGGIQIWSSNPAILWTARRSEQEGIHVHAFSEDGRTTLIDETFSHVVIDGIGLDMKMVQTLMAQSALPHLVGRVTSIDCPSCKEPHFDTAENAFTPHDHHLCISCGFEFRSRGRMRKTIGNPIIGVLAHLAQKAPRIPQQHESGLPPEII